MKQIELIQKFRLRGYKMTPQRRAIIEVTASSSSHPTAEEIHKIVSKQMPDISLATVYNTLRELVVIGAAYEMNLSDDARHYEFSQEPHSHFVCSRCGEIQDVQMDQDELARHIKLDGGSLVTRYDIVIHGYCANCAPAEMNGQDESKPPTVKIDEPYACR